MLNHSVRCISYLVVLNWFAVAGAKPIVPSLTAAQLQVSPLSRWLLGPSRIVWTSQSGVTNGASLLQPPLGQAVLKNPQPACVLAPPQGSAAGGGILLDFGTELTGNIELFTPISPDKEPRLVRIRFGESVAEAMSDLGGTTNAENDHAIRDQRVRLPWLGKKTVGPGGFRFVRIDNVDPGHPVSLSEIRAVLLIRDLPQIGSFRCDDERLNRIWQVGAYTVHLNMQDYLWDGVKRDRLVWIGDMGPEVATINAVFGSNEVVPRSLDLTRDLTPVSAWMNGISSYSMWWVLIQEQWWMHGGDRPYLEAQRSYLQGLLKKFASLIGPDGHERIDGTRFLDWPSSSNPQGVTAGLQALLVMTLESGSRLMHTLGDEQTAALCTAAAAEGHRVVPEVNASKSGAALLALAGMMDARNAADDILKVGGPKNISTFYGYYVLQALAKAGETDTALDFISTYWGAMLDLGATTFWEDFDLDWTKNAGRIDELVPLGKIDVHGGYGAYCYIGFRHSLCHGWASGPTAWLSENVLGITPLEPGFTRVRIVPQLGHLKWAEGSYPTPLGAIKVRHERQPDGSIKSQIDAPAGITVVRAADLAAPARAILRRAEPKPDPTP
jgi:alpha-L-rhamnosidase